MDVRLLSCPFLAYGMEIRGVIYSNCIHFPHSERTIYKIFTHRKNIQYVMTNNNTEERGQNTDDALLCLKEHTCLVHPSTCTYVQSCIMCLSQRVYNTLQLIIRKKMRHNFIIQTWNFGKCTLKLNILSIFRNTGCFARRDLSFWHKPLKGESN